MNFDLGALSIGIPALVPIALLGAIAAFAIWAILGAVSGPAASRDVPRDDLYPRRLDRSRSRSPGGVCAGIARYFGWQVGTTRAAFVFLAFFSAGFTVVLIYLVLWRLMPLEPMPVVKEFALEDYQLD